jgi:Kef-type K+ transport system membrane component KefB
MVEPQAITIGAWSIQSLTQLPPLLQFSIVLGAGLIAGEFARRFLQWPVIVGYMLAGVALGSHVFGVLNAERIATLAPLVDVALGFVLFELGRRLDIGWIKLNGWLLPLSLVEMTTVFAAVYIFLLTQSIEPMAAGLIAAMAIASSPAVIMAVTRELGAEGQVTKRALCLTALNCFVAFIVMTTLLALAKRSQGLQHVALEALQQVGGALLLGVVFGWLLCFLARAIGKTQERQFVLMVAALAGAAGLANALDVSLLITLLTMGIYARNIDAGEGLMMVRFGFATQLLFLVLFVVAGASMQWTMGISLTLVIALVVIRAAAKLGAVTILGAWGGLDYKRSVWLGAALLPMGEIGLVMTAAAYKHTAVVGQGLFSAMLMAVALNELIGPLIARTALIRAGEAKPIDPFADDRIAFRA